MKKIISIALIIMVLAGILYFFISPRESDFKLVSAQKEVTIYKSSNCGCCGIYSGYFERKGDIDAKVVNKEDMSSIRDEYEIPSSLSSCHTTVIGNYFIEGHIPLEAVNKLLLEKPDIRGIAMPGMPSGSPGMPGSKQSDFKIYSVNKDSSYSEFMRI